MHYGAPTPPPPHRCPPKAADKSELVGRVVVVRLLFTGYYLAISYSGKVKGGLYKATWIDLKGGVFFHVFTPDEFKRVLSKAVQHDGRA